VYTGIQYIGKQSKSKYKRNKKYFHVPKAKYNGNQSQIPCLSFNNANFHSGKLSVDWKGQENISLSCELWVGTNDVKTKNNFLRFRSNPRIIFLSGN
jgi:hypothetical protein